jgi:hypothetical protein
MGLGILVIIVFAIIIAAIYWLAQQCIWLGPVIMVGALVLYLIIKDQNEDAALICAGIFFAGLIIFLFGISTTAFFQNNPTGKGLMNFSNGVINTSQEYYKAVTVMTPILQHLIRI